jgi:hypothetical protein
MPAKRNVPTAKAPAKPSKELCHLCKKEIMHDRLVQHLKQIHGKIACTRANIEEFNKSEDELPDVVAEAEEEERTTAMKEESSDDDILTLSATTKSLSPRLIVPKQVKSAGVSDDEEKAPPAAPPKKKDARRGQLHLPEADFDNDITLDDYLADKSDNSTLGYHHRFLTSCIAIVSNTGTYVVKQRIGGKVVCKQFEKKGLVKILETKSATVQYRARNIDIGYGKLIDLPAINNSFKRFTAVDFAGEDPNVFHLWRGHAWRVFRPEEEVDMALIQPFLDHVKNIICAGNERLFQIEITKDAWMYQNPNSHLKWATVMIGEEGAGKGTYTDPLCDLWGRAYSNKNINSTSQITSDNIRGVLDGVKIVATNELRSLEKGPANFDALKSRITDDTYTLRNLYEDPISCQNVNNYFFSTNNYDSIQVGIKDRRYFVLEVSAQQVGNLEYFAKLQATFTPEFYEHLLNYFLRCEVTEEFGFSPFKPIDTELKTVLKEMSLDLQEQFMEQFSWSSRDKKVGLTSDQLWVKYVDWCDKMSLDRERMGKSGIAFGMKIRRYVRTERKKVGDKTKLYYFPAVGEAPSKPDDSDDGVEIESDDDT